MYVQILLTPEIRAAIQAEVVGTTSLSDAGVSETTVKYLSRYNITNVAELKSFVQKQTGAKIFNLRSVSMKTIGEILDVLAKS
jgi:hypothetical protein